MTVRSSTSTGIPIAPSSVIIPTGGTFDLYNTADQTTNYERLRAEWSSNIARLYVQSAGTGIDRDFRVGTATLYHIYQQRTNATPLITASLVSTTATTANGIHQLYSGTLSASSGTQTPVSIAPTFNQSGTAGYTALDINPTETATGSGTKLLQRWAVGGSTQAQMNAAGTLWLSYVAAINNIGFTNSIGSANDVTLTRDAADTLALRRDTIAQTFRIYNTYTDPSNYERGVIYWNSNVFTIDTGSAGTGTARAMTIGTSGATDLTIKTNGSGRWQFNSSGHFVAGTDNTYDIGASGANRPRAVYAALALNAPEWRMSTVTVAGLSATNNSRMMVSDSTLPFTSANVGTAVTGGGANTVPVIRIGGTWYIG